MSRASIAAAIVIPLLLLLLAGVWRLSHRAAQPLASLERLLGGDPTFCVEVLDEILTVEFNDSKVAPADLSGVSSHIRSASTDSLYDAATCISVNQHPPSVDSRIVTMVIEELVKRRHLRADLLSKVVFADPLAPDFDTGLRLLSEADWRLRRDLQATVNPSIWERLQMAIEGVTPTERASFIWDQVNEGRVATAQLLLDERNPDRSHRQALNLLNVALEDCKFEATDLACEVALQTGNDASPSRIPACVMTLVYGRKPRTRILIAERELASEQSPVSARAAALTWLVDTEGEDIDQSREVASFVTSRVPNPSREEIALAANRKHQLAGTVPGRIMCFDNRREKAMLMTRGR